MSVVAHETIDEVVARCAPTSVSIGAEWTAAQQDSVLTEIIGHPTAQQGGLSVVHELLADSPHRPTRRRRALLPLAASIAVLAAGAGTLLAVVPPDGGSTDSGAVGALPAPEPFDPPAGLSAKALLAGEWSYSVVQQNDIDARGRVIPKSPDAMTIRTWINARGDVYEIRSGQQNSCTYRPEHRNARLDAPTVAFFRSLPTTGDALRAYLRRQAQGTSSSRDEAVFVAVGDTLRTADGLASPKLRGAFVAALSRTPGVLVHRDVRDQFGRAALRLDFVDQQIRPGEVQSLFFSPTDFRLLEERDGSNGAPHRYAGPSPAYTHSASTGRDPETLTGPGYVETHSGQRVVRRLPAMPSSCTTASGRGG